MKWIWVPVAVVVAAACSPAMEADVSPDGSMVAAVRDGKLRLVTKTGAVITSPMRGNLAHPRFSPDGKTVAVSRVDNGHAETYLINLKGKVAKLLPEDIQGPYSCSPDGRLLGWKGATGAIVDADTGRILQILKLPKAPEHVAWHGDTVVSASERTLWFSDHGKTSEWHTKEPIEAVAIDATTQEAVFLANTTDVSSARGQIVVYRAAANQEPHVEGTFDLTAASGSQFSMIQEATIADDGKKLALTAVVPAKDSPDWGPALRLANYLEKHPKDQEVRASAQKVFDRLKFDMVVATYDLTSQKVALLSRKPTDTILNGGHVVFSGDGNTVALVDSSGIKRFN